MNQDDIMILAFLLGLPVVFLAVALTWYCQITILVAIWEHALLLSEFIKEKLNRD